MSDDKGAFRRLLRTRPHFRRLWYSNMVSLLGDWLSFVAVSTVTVDQGGTGIAVALLLLAHTLPMAVMAPISGPLADRIDRRTVMIAAHLGAAGLTGLVWLMAESGAVWWMQAMLVLRVAVSGVGMTARLAALPQVVEEDELHAANALMGLTWSIMFAAGVAIGGLIAELLGPGEAILLDAATFVFAALLIRGLPPLPPRAESDAPAGRPGPGEMVAAWRYARPRPGLFASVLAKTPPAIATGAGWVSLNLLAESRMGELALGLGVMHALRAVGTGVGPLLPRRLLPRESNVGSPMAFIGLALFLVFESPWVFMPALVLWGMGTGHNWVTSTAEIQANTPGPMLGRMNAIALMTVQLSEALLAVIAGLIIDATLDPTSGTWLAVAFGVAMWAWLMVVRRRPEPVAEAG